MQNNSNVNYARRSATDLDLIENLDMVKKVWGIYKDLYKVELVKWCGILTVKNINELIIKAKKIAETKIEHEIAVEGMFDSYAAILFSYSDSAIAEEMVDKKLEELTQIKNGK